MTIQTIIFSVAAVTPSTQREKEYQLAWRESSPLAQWEKNENEKHEKLEKG